MGACPSICSELREGDPQVLMLKQDISPPDVTTIGPVEASPLDESQRNEKRLTQILALKGQTIEPQEMESNIHPELQRKRKDFHKTFPSEKGTYEQPPLKMKNGNIYHGYWNEHAEMEGPGVMVMNEGWLLEGLWKNGSLAKGRVYSVPNPGTYEGEVEGGMANGHGSYIYPNGIVYDGNWKDNHKNGKGTLTFPDDSKINGEFENDEITSGKMYWPDHTFYEGQFKNSMLNGKGKMTWMNGIIYEGDFVNTTITGNGKMQMPLQGQAYEGEWLNNRMHGNGLYTWPSDTTFDGVYEHGAKVSGVYTKGQSLKYTGGFASNKPNGKASIEVKGEQFQGYWRHGKLKEVEKENEALVNFIPETEAILSTELPHIQSVNIGRCNTFKAKDNDMNSLDLTVKSPTDNQYSSAYNQNIQMHHAAPQQSTQMNMTSTHNATPGAGVSSGATIQANIGNQNYNQNLQVGQSA